MKNIRDYHTYLKIALPILVIIAFGLNSSSSQATAIQTREVRVVGADAVAGQPVNVSVELVSQGNENRVGFSLNFDASIFSAPVVTLGTGATGATLTVNGGQAVSGRLGIDLALPAGQTFTMGTPQLVSISLSVAANAPIGPTSITFGDQPVVSQVTNVSTAILTTVFTAGTVNIVQPNPIPFLIGLSPSSASAGGSGFTLIATGTSFVNGAVIRWNGSQRNTTFVSSSQLIALIPASDIAAVGTATVTAANPAPGGGLSNGLTFTINNPAPSITTITPTSANVGSSNVTLTVNGTSFISTSVVRFNGTDLATTFVSATQLTATIPASSLTAAGVANVNVFTPSGGTSNTVTFTINNLVPAITSLNPNFAAVGSSGLTLTVTGTGFATDSTVQFNGSARTTTFVSATQLTAAIPAADLATAGTASITVVNPAPGGGTSNAVNFVVGQPNPVPTITTLSPVSAGVGGAAFTLTVNGTNFVSSSSVRFNGSDRPTTFVSATQVTAAIPATDLATAGTASITVFNPAPGGGTSNAVSFAIVPPAQTPAITRLSPSFAIAGGQAFTLTVTGSNFSSSSVVRWNDSDRPTTFGSATQLTAAIPATDIATAGTAMVKVFTPAPGGGTSNALPFTIGNSQLTSVSAASFLGPEIANESIVAGFSVNLATQTQAATVIPLPTDMAGTKIMVRDSLGMTRLAPQFFVSPLQVNYQLPPDTATGEAVVVNTSSDNKIAVGTVQVSRIVPGVFTANADGQGVLAATVLRVKPDNSRVFESLVRRDSTTNKFVPVMVDLGPATDRCFLVMAATGVRFRSALSAVIVRIGGTNAGVTFAGPAPGFIGLDQLNVEIPRSLIGRGGEVNVELIVDGKPANVTKMSIK